ncbi:hypothetical protein DFH06DRAFT_1195752 [Mycena polygramma]|nr:hypothetical protein DFH06DRAFT_1195752 [Mycena polygramma]
MHPHLVSPRTPIYLLLLTHPCPHPCQHNLGPASRSTVPKSPTTESWSLKFRVSIETYRRSQLGAGNRRWNFLADANWLQCVPVHLFHLFFHPPGTTRREPPRRCGIDLGCAWSTGGTVCDSGRREGVAQTCVCCITECPHACSTVPHTKSSSAACVSRPVLQR